MAVQTGGDTVDYGASDPQAFVKGAAGMNALAQNYAQRQAGQALASGNSQGASDALYNAGDIAGGNSVVDRHVATLNNSRDLDRQAHADSLKFVQDTATALEEVRAHGGDPVAAFDKLIPVFQQREGATPETIETIRNQLATNAQVFLQGIAAHTQHQLQILSQGQEAIDEHGNVLRRNPLAPHYATVGPGQSEVRDDTEGSLGLGNLTVGGNSTAGANSFAPQPGQPPEAAPNGGPPPLRMTVNQAIIGQESRGNPNAATSVDGARGIGQITPATFTHFARPGEHINNPTDNLNVANRIIDHYLAAYQGDPARAAVAYFSGPGNVAPPGSATPWLRDARDGNGVRTSSYVQQVLGRMGVSPAGPPQGTPPAGVTTAGGATVIAQGAPKPAEPFTLAPGATRYGPDGKPIVTAPAKPAAVSSGKLPTQDAARLKAMDTMVDSAEVLSNMAQDWLARAHRTHANTGWIYNSFGGHGSAQGGGAQGGIRPGQVINAAINPDMRSAIQELDAISNRATPMLRPVGTGRILGTEYVNFGRAFPNTANDMPANEQMVNEYVTGYHGMRTKQLFFHQWAAEHGNLDGADAAWTAQRDAPAAPAQGGGRHRVWTPDKGVQ